jgi:hypothetical protein
MDANYHKDKTGELDKVRDDLSYATGERHVAINDLMTNNFIVENTAFESWQNLIGAAGVSDETDFEKPDFDEFIKSNTRFKDWEEMLIYSANQYALRKEPE